MSAASMCASAVRMAISEAPRKIWSDKMCACPLAALHHAADGAAEVLVVGRLNAHSQWQATRGNAEHLRTLKGQT